MKKSIIGILLLLVTGVFAQNPIYLSIADRLKQLTVTEEVSIQEYLLTTSKLYGGMEVKSKFGEMKVIHFATTLAKDLMEKFPVGSKVTLEYGQTGNAYISPDAAVFFKRNGIQFSDLPSSRMPFRINRLTLEHERAYLATLGKRELRLRRVNGLVSVQDEHNRVVYNRNEEAKKIRPKPDELIKDVMVEKFKKIDRFNALITLENGRELTLKRYYKNNLRKTNTFLIQYPWIFEGEVATEEFYEKPERVIPIYSYQVELTKPVYDNWSRLFAYEAIVDGDERIVKFETFHAKRVKEYAEKNLGKSQRFYMTKKAKRLVKDDDQGRFTGFTHMLTTLPVEDKLQVLDDRFESYKLQDTIQFVSKIKSIRRIKSKNQKWLQIYEDGVVLENGYAVRFSWKVKASIKDQLKQGKEVEIVGVPYQPKKGEIYEEGVKQMLNVISIKIDGLNYKISSE